MKATKFHRIMFSSNGTLPMAGKMEASGESVHDASFAIALTEGFMHGIWENIAAPCMDVMAAGFTTIDAPTTAPKVLVATVASLANEGVGFITNTAEVAMMGSRPEDIHCDMFAGFTVRADAGAEKASSAPRQMWSVWLPSSTTTVDVATNGDVKGTLRKRSTSTWPTRTVHVSGKTRRLKQGRGRYSVSVSITASTSDMPMPLITLIGSD